VTRSKADPGARSSADRASGLRSVSPPKQARSQQTLLRLLDATEALIEEKSLPDVSVPEIVRRAGSSVGGFYARFKDKDELLRALEERFFGRLYERVEHLAQPAKWQTATLAEIVTGCAKELVAVRRENPNLIAAFVARSTRERAALDEAIRFQREVERRIGTLLLTRREEMSHPEPEIAVDLGVQFAFGLVIQSIARGETFAGSKSLGDSAIAREITRNVLGYLGCPTTPS
jgi:AcrR family transcriptional regulator